jgi:hypothetical protein
MDFDEVLDKVVELLQREQRVSYRSLKVRFRIDDEYIEALRAELIDAKRIAADEDGKVLVWTGTLLVPSSKFQVSGSQSPIPPPQSLAPSTQHPGH